MKDKVVFLVKDVFIVVVEWDIYIGDVVIISVVIKDGVIEEVFLLRRD